ncbi:MAG: SURF1 family protein [Alphaproteobacteria bacterium]|nr:MAG: SURF1 family protein [Alphaproteobacteria bacterium]
MRRLAFVAVIGVAGLSVLLALGFWQLRRLAWKEGILAEIAARMAAPVAALPARPEESRDEYRRVTLRGVIGGGEIRVLTSLPPHGPGFRVIQPMTLEDGRRILVDRGFIPEADRDRPRPGGAVTLNGNLLWPDETGSWTPEPNLARNIWFARDVAAMARQLGTEPVLVVAASETGDAILPVPVTVNIPNDHLEYALTWFGLAAAWAAMTVWFVLRGGDRGVESGPPRG